MGTDIHGFIQRKYGDGKYENIGKIEDGRNYLVFAALANVRNGTGFAGVKTHEPIQPIAEPRDLPDDLGIERWPDYNTVRENQPEDFGDHSFSWLTLTEVIEWPGWDAHVNMTGIVDRQEFVRMQASGLNPESWCGGISGHGVKIVDQEEALKAMDGDWTHVQVRWTVPIKEYMSTFHKWIDYLQSKYGRLLKNDPTAIRLVFGFDS